MFESRKYVVQPGDTLINIAAQHRLPSWRAIFDAPANINVKRLRGTPERIQPGDVFLIPPDPVKLIEYKIDRLLRVRQESEEMFNKLLAEANMNYRGVKRTASAVDTAATVAQLGVGYSKIVKGGFDAMKKTGAELAKANRALAKTAVKNGRDFVRDQAIQQSSFMKVTGEEGLALAITKITLKSWFDMTTPSYWAQRFSGVNIEQIHRETIANIQRQKTKSIGNIERRIAELKNELMKLRLDK